MKQYIAVVDYGVGNLKSVSNALGYLGMESKIATDRQTIEGARAIYLPGVGAFPDAAAKLRATGLDQVILQQVGKMPILGVCLGMQLLFDYSEEGEVCKGLSLVSGSVKRIDTSLKLPHIGWNSLHFPQQSPLFQGLDEGAYVYFVHSFSARPEQMDNVIATTEYGMDVVAAVEKNGVYGCQFHPEISGEIGLQILKNFGELSR